jgi:predicted AlkP superfamily pyrophosphatase or phosphodiesterase
MNKKVLLFCLTLILYAQTGYSQTSKAEPKPQHAIQSGTKPKLIVGIVVDQMRYDYIFRFWEKYSEGGFKRLVNGGFLLKDANYNYVPTYTAPGHACIYSGTTPSYNVIISNDWFDRKLSKTMYCVSDSTVKSIGTNAETGKMSPKNLLTTTVTDELRLSNNFESKVIGVSLKDRGAILPAGHTANAVYWHEPGTNNFISSSYYMRDLPQWVNDFNQRYLVDAFLSKPWTTLLPIESYTESTADDNAYEGLYRGETKPVFPHDLSKIKLKDAELIRKTPFGNTFLKEFAEAAIKGENLGKGTTIDFLTVSFSSTDYVGHMFGTNAIEIEDTYLRLDRDLEELLSFLDKWIGKENILVFLTADHGGANNPQFNEDHGIPASQFDSNPMADSLKNYLNKVYEKADYVSYADAHSIYLNHALIEQKHISLEEIENRCLNYISHFEGVAVTLSAEELKKGNCKTGVQSLMQNGFNNQRSADVMIELAPGWIDWSTKTGTTHGSAYSYDTHVPLIFYGWKIPKGSSSAPVKMTDVAPTISALLNIENPSGCTGSPIPEIVK